MRSAGVPEHSWRPRPWELEHTLISTIGFGPGAGAGVYWASVSNPPSPFVDMVSGAQGTAADGKAPAVSTVTTSPEIAVERARSRLTRTLPRPAATGKRKGQHPSPATVMRMLREHDEETAATVVG